MARIRYIAIVVKDSEEMATFFKSAFGLTEVFRHHNDETGDQSAIYLSDGYINLALLPIDRPLGVDHVGFMVDDVEAQLEIAVAAGAARPERQLPRDGRQAEAFVRDPQLGLKLDISQGWLIEPK